MAKFGELTIYPTTGHSSCGFTSERIVRSHVAVDTCGESGVYIEVDRDQETEIVVPKALLTLEEAWVLYTQLRGVFYKTREAEQLLYKNKYNLD